MINKENVTKAIVLIAVLGVLIFFSSARPIEALRTLAFKFLKPLASFAGRLSRITPAAADKEVGEQMAVRFEIETLREENSRFRRALSMRGAIDVSTRGVGVLSYFQEFGNEFLLLEEGSEAGFKKGDVVLDHFGFIVGFLYEVGDQFAKVAVASNAGTAFESELIPGSTKVLAKSIGGRAFSLELLPSDVPIRTGDFVGIAHNIGGSRKTFLLAEVRESVDGTGSIFKEARAVLVARPETLNTIFIVSPSQ